MKIIEKTKSAICHTAAGIVLLMSAFIMVMIAIFVAAATQSFSFGIAMGEKQTVWKRGKA